MKNFDYTQNWFDQTARPLWDQFIKNNFSPTTYLEIGSFEGASVCWVIENLPSVKTAVCIDTWEGGEEHKKLNENMAAVEIKFDANTQLAGAQSETAVDLIKLKSRSVEALGRLISEGYSDFFDFVYIDGSHVASDVLTDLVQAFELLKVGGLLVADDYLWDPEFSTEGKVTRINPNESPKLAIDAFSNIFRSNLRILAVPPIQFMALKT
jgi:predicted O-methyltransferase YrrM